MCVGAGKVSRKILNPAEEDSLVVRFKSMEEGKSFPAGTEKTGPGYSKWFKEPQMWPSYSTVCACFPR